MNNNMSTQIDAYNVPLFCSTHNISRAFFYKLLAQGLAPKTIKIGRRLLISKESAASWRKSMEEGEAIEVEVV